MSRAAALARNVRPSVIEPQQASDDTQVRLLGDAYRAGAAGRRPRPAPPARKRTQRESYMQVWDQMAFEPYYPATPRPRRAPLQVRHPGWLMGTVFGMFALIAVVSPVLAAGRQTAKGRALSMYGAPAALGDQAAAPVIDVTTPLEGPAPQAEPQPVGPPAEGEYAVQGAPSLSVGKIEEVLHQYGSPAAGLGQALLDLGVRYGIDPAYALAFFVHESGCGTKGVARFSRSLGNIRWTPGYDSYEGYRAYPTWEAGFEDWYKLITELYINGWGLRTVDAIVPVYAPWGDNNHPPTYIASVKTMVDSWRGK